MWHRCLWESLIVPAVNHPFSEMTLSSWQIQSIQMCATSIPKVDTSVSRAVSQYNENKEKKYLFYWMFDK
jgi:hypothetical protein